MQYRNELGFLVPSRYGKTYPKGYAKETPTASHSAIPTSPVPTAIPNTIMGSSHSSPKQQDSHKKPGPNLLTIPLEIRLQIYNYVLLAHPIHHAHLAPLTPPPNFSGLNTVEFHTTMKRAKTSPDLPTEVVTYTLIKSTPPSPESDSQPRPHPTYISTTLPSSLFSTNTRIQGKLPTALLLSNKQIYAEISLLPFHTSTFSFVNWFQSGVYAARSFTKGLQPWQREAMRIVKVEVMGRDLWCGRGKGREEGKGLEYLGRKEGVNEWRELCGLWGGVRELRLVLKGLVGDGSSTGLGSSSSSSASRSDSAISEQIQKENEQVSILSVDSEWVSGLLSMKSLRTLELEIADVDVNREVKMEFCTALDRALNAEERNGRRSDGWPGRTSVVFVERSEVVLEKKVEKFVYYGGEPGDEVDWRV
ncbi:hypothetical protein VTL71DRAFT_7820 [Oculimacula yallundae]|uniref:Uncharacterized protein n=1 Tax=Oculimacula yallundae TaxID=86028 RepID=A0ABR4CWS7_9HELO